MANLGSTQLEQAGYKQELKRVLSFRDVLLYAIAMMLPIAPVTIYGVVTTATGGHMALAYIIAVIPMSFTALSYGQMAGAFPFAGSAYSYTQRALNPHLGLLVGWTLLIDYVLFPLLNYICIVIYTTALFPNLDYWVIIIVSLGLVSLINALGIESVSKVNNMLVIFMFLIIAYFLGSSIWSLTHGVGAGVLFSTKPFYNPESFQLNSLLLGASIACFSFLGFDAASTLAEEVENPAKNISKGVVLACLIIGSLFVIQAYFAQLIWPGYTGFHDIDSAFLDVAARAGGQTLSVLFTIAMISGCFANAIDSQAGACRLLFGMGRDEVLPKKLFGYLHPKTKVPVLNIVVIGIISLIGAALLGLEEVVTMINFGALTGFMMVNLSVIRHYYVKNHQRDLMGTIKYLVLPGIGFLTCLTLFINLSMLSKIVGSIWVIIGIIYAAFTTDFFKKTPPTLS